MTGDGASPSISSTVFCFRRLAGRGATSISKTSKMSSFGTPPVDGADRRAATARSVSSLERDHMSARTIRRLTRSEQHCDPDSFVVVTTMMMKGGGFVTRIFRGQERQIEKIVH